ncbi:D-alanyl-D-alanine carboxypeptidase family protein [uncultured Devosia sp.]|uniref:D-alanyl-D-alanine carboxypeptidase family protein n=1 Tax=uncultured Devosia sp. TaxID=211434 RepID=UPI0035CA02BD
MVRSLILVQHARQFGVLAFAVLLSFAGLGGLARANPMLLVDMDTLEVLSAEDAGLPWHPASLTKLMTAYVTFEEIAKGTVSLDTPVVLSRHAINQAPSKSGLPVDSALSMQDALYVMLVKSANDVAMGIAETVGGSEAGFVAKMNDAASRMGLTASHFANPNGLDDPEQRMSARDLAVLALYIRKSFPQYDPIFGTEAVQLGGKRLESENQLLTKFAGTTGMKTGFICASGLNMVATVERNGRRLLAVVLGASSGRDRNERAAELMLRGFSGSAGGTGQSVLGLANSPGVAPVNMRPQICGKQAAAYVKAQEAAFPMGLKGQPSYLNDVVAAATYMATDLGRIRANIALPRPRPMHLPAFPAVAGAAELRPGLSVAVDDGVPFPRPRPSFSN